MENNLCEGLNEEQTKAVRLINAPLLIIAGAGSGKTKVLTRKIAYLIEEKNYSPMNILGVTFTNKAAGEMKSRVEQITGIDGKIFNISTFHSLGLRILRDSGMRFGYNDRWQICDDRDQKRIVSKLVKDRFSWFTSDMIDGIVKKINRSKMKLFYPNNSASLLKRGFTEEETRLFSDYYTYQKNNKLWDFEDLVSLPVILMMNDNELRKKYENKFKYVLVDEFQDTNPNQYELIRLIASGHKRITVVGDDDQAIYSWRGADIRSMSDFEKDFSGVKIVKLERNYRSTSNILDFANGLIRKNYFRKMKKMWTDRKDGDPVSILFSGSKESEAEYIARLIENLPDGPDFSPVAILYRVNSQSLPLETVFQNNNIKYKVVKGLRFFDRKEVKDAVALLRMALDPDDNLAFIRMISFLPLGIGKKTLSEVEKLSIEKNTSFFKTLAENFPDKFNSKPVFLKILELNRDALALTPSKILADLLHISGYFDSLSKRGEESKVLNLEELLGFIKSWEAENIDYKDYSGLLDRLALDLVKTKKDEGEKVLLLTMHNSKGLEFPTVIVVGTNSTYLPFFMRKGAMEIEEERRLFYVASTRAVNRLIVSTGGSKESMFISEANLNGVKMGYSFTDILGFLNMNGDIQNSSDSPSTDSEIVVHPVFGKGVVRKKLDEQRFLIDFEEKGQKVIDTSIIKLEY